MPDPPMIVSPASAAAAWPEVELRLVARLAAHAQQAAGAYAEATERARRADRRAFAAWCAGIGVTPLPATGPQPSSAISTTAPAGGHRLTTIERRLSSIRYLHEAAGFSGPANPGRSEAVRLAMRRLARSLGRQQRRGAAPLGQRETGQILAALRADPGPQQLRDLALLLVLQDGMLRRAEAAALDLADLDLGDDGGGTVTVRRSKTDIAGAGVTLYLGPRTCFWLKRWIDRAAISEGAVFRAVNKAGGPGGRLRTADVNRRLKALAQAAGSIRPWSAAKAGGAASAAIWWPPASPWPRSWTAADGRART